MLSYPVIWESNDLLWDQIECCDWSQPVPNTQTSQISPWRDVWEEQTSQQGTCDSVEYWREEKKIDLLPREPFTRFLNIQVIKKSSDNEVGLFRSSAIFWSQVIKFFNKIGLTYNYYSKKKDSKIRRWWDWW